MTSFDASPSNPLIQGNPRRTRAEHSQETAQDYVELIATLIAQTGEARIVDLARRLGVTHVTVARTIQRLQRDGLVTTQPYRAVFLTDAGRKLAEESRRRHEIVVAFLRALGIPDAVAQSDAEGIEHHVSKETLAAFQKHLGLAHSQSSPCSLTDPS
ncbi:MAG TPA: manganese-binding transcriptional regulator MntR [Chthoniobacterales bacterium]